MNLGEILRQHQYFVTANGSLFSPSRSGAPRDCFLRLGGIDER